MSFEFLSQFQNEIIAGLAILVLLTIYLLLKSRPTTKENLLEIEPIVMDEYDLDKKHKNNTEKDIYDTDENQKESQTEDIKTSEPEIPTEKPSYETQIQESITKFQKQLVPHHEKIKKEDFSKFRDNRILLAEDNIINQKVILGLLGESGMEIIVANDGKEALEILEKDDDFMLILMDAHMPNIDGFEATKIIRSNPKYNHIVVVALSGDTASDDIKKMKDAGMSETLEKPLKMDSLYDILYAYDTTKQNISIKGSNNSFTDILNINKGLSICGDDQEFYKDILNEFISDYRASDEALRILIKEQKIREADMLLLDIIGVSANLGANDLNLVSITVKEVLKNSSQDIPNILQIYQKTLQLTVTTIHNFLKNN
ncbi:response regulator [Sulfurimonas sp.]